MRCPNHPDADIYTDGYFVYPLGGGGVEWIDGVKHVHEAGKRKGGHFCREGCLIITEDGRPCPVEDCDYGKPIEVIEVRKGEGRRIMDQKHVGFARPEVHSGTT